LINEFFEITRFNLSNLSLEISRLNMTRMLEQIVYEFKPLLDEKNLSCHLDIDHHLDIRCDVPKIERVFDNLIRNAINYSFEDSTIVISAKKKPSGIQLKFKNSGNTIPPEKLIRIFEQFFRLDTARTSNTGGAGLGLAIAKEIVELHKGTISAYSANEMIEFTIDLPFL
jgi:two-component system sensor histidine kinase VanS